MKQQKVRLYQWRALFGAAALVLCAFAGYLLFQDAVNIIDWFKGFGIWSPVLFTIALSLAIVLLLPTPFVKVGAGAIFPFWIAVAVNFIASMVGGLIAFVIGRWLFRDSIQEAIQNDQRMLNIEAALGEDAMRISVLVRLSPILPDEWLNYIMSATPVSLRVFLLSNVSSLIYCLIYAYYGHALGSIALSQSGVNGSNTNERWSLPFTSRNRCNSPCNCDCHTNFNPSSQRSNRRRRVSRFTTSMNP
ncbi:MAG: TVP38/TMEM64 family protein [Candidatus Poseidoniaceae archaeon]